MTYYRMQWLVLWLLVAGAFNDFSASPAAGPQVLAMGGFAVTARRAGSRQKGAPTCEAPGAGAAHADGGVSHGDALFVDRRRRPQHARHLHVPRRDDLRRSGASFSTRSLPQAETLLRKRQQDAHTQGPVP